MTGRTTPKGTTPKAKAKANGAAPAERRYKRAKIVRLEFGDGELEGLAIRTRRPSIDELFDITAQAEGLGDVDIEAMSPEQAAQARDMLGMFAEYLVWWNLDEDVLGEDGEPTGEERAVAPTLEGLLSQDLGLVVPVFWKWLGAMGDVPAPLDRRSSGGGPSEVPQIPMEPLS